MTPHPNETRCYNFRVRRLTLTICGLVAAALLLPAAAFAYPWPIRPFYQPHAIRGYFNDPRLSGPETGFHFGVDIVAADMTPVYASEGGRVVARGMTVSIFPKRGGHLLSYWHVIPSVRSRQRVRQHQLIGHVAPGAGHVHLAEHRDGTYVNPIRLGGLAPYVDDTPPQISGMVFSSFGQPLRPEAVRGLVDITVSAFDVPPLPALPAEWAQAKLSPALIRWRLAQGQNTVRPWETSVDFRTFLVPFSLFNFVYAPETFQNRPNHPGNYVYYLAHEFDTRTLPNGSYVLQVDALDEQENVGQALFGFIVAN
jgi:peptidase M23-like protein